MSTPAETLQAEQKKLELLANEYNTFVNENERARLEKVAALQQQQGRVNFAKEQAEAEEGEVCPAPDSLSQT
tara:strand:- start:464 stop:679 length:216 start_codon:yes stop_codon:yes gene_type:complete